MALSLRRNTASSTSGADNDYQPLITDTNGRLHVLDANTAAIQTAVELIDNAISGAQMQVDLVDGNVTNAGTFVVQEDGAALTALQLIDDVVATDDTTTHATGTTKGVNIMAAATPTDGSVAANDIGSVAMSTDRRLHVDAQIVGTDAALDVSGATVTVDLGANNDVTLNANSGVDIGDVDVTSISAGSNLVADVGLSGARTSGGIPSRFYSIDLDETEEEVKATAGQIYSIHAMNLTNAKLYLRFYNLTAANTTVGTSTLELVFPLATQGDTNGAGFTASWPNGLEFDTAISVACTTGIADNDTGAPGANSCVVNISYA